MLIVLSLIVMHLKLVPCGVILISVPPALNVKSEFTPVVPLEIVDPIIVKSPSERAANDNVPDPSVFKKCPVNPSA